VSGSLAELVRGAARSADRHLAVSESDLVDRPAVRASLARAGLGLVIARELPVERALRSLGGGCAVLVVVDAGTRCGVPLRDFIDRRVRDLRGHAPYAGVAVIAGSEVNVRLLPPRTWVIAGDRRPVDVAPMVRAVLENREAHEEVFGAWPPAAAHPRATRRARPLGAITRTVPNFNVRHPAMLVPVARTASAVGMPVVCEISPQEALTYYEDGGGTGDHRRRVRAVLSRLREDVDLVVEATGCELRLHLDHCDDPELIVFALGTGFDSIMADGSARSLALNVRFTRHAVEQAAAFGVPVEGEVGSMDPHGRRKTSRTLLEDLRTFVEGTGVDCVGVNVGQVHGSDYGYRRSQRAIRDIDDLERTHGGDDPLSLYLACSELDAELAVRSVAAHHADRRCLQRTRERLVEEPHTPAHEVVRDAYASVAVACWSLLARLEERWQERRLAVATRRTALCRSVTLGGGWLETGREQRFLDLDLLRQASAAVADTGARVVLHGGSSIAYDELRLLPALGVARVNVGSRPFAGFLRALTARCPEPAAFQPTEVWDVVRFLGEHAADWRDWLGSPPSFLPGYEDELRRRYFDPLG
jgi:fructose/tagatose bisphosphate aldolase